MAHFPGHAMLDCDNQGKGKSSYIMPQSPAGIS